MAPLVGLLLELVASEAWNALKNKLRPPSPSWAADVAERVADSSADLTREEQDAIKRWLERADVFSAVAQATPDTVQQVAARVIAPLEFELGDATPDRRRRAEEIAATTIRSLVEFVDPAIAATLSTFQSLKRDTTALMEGQAVIVDAIEGSTQDVIALLTPTVDLEGQLASLPPPVAAIILELDEHHDRAAALLAAWLKDPATITNNLRQLVANPPAWLEHHLDSRLWEAIAVAADAHALNDIAVLAYERAAELAPASRPRLLARAAVSASAADSGGGTADNYIHLARVSATPADSAFIEAAVAAIGGHSQALEQAALTAINEGAPDQTLLRIWGARAQLEQGRPSDAITLLQSVGDDDPLIGGTLMTRAMAYLSRATSSLSSSKMTDLHSALDCAIRARDHRRRWGGDSGHPTELACQAAFLLNDFDAVERLASAIDGEASESEAARPEVRQLLALVRTLRNSPTAPPSTPFEMAWLRGLQAMSDADRRSEAIAALTEAAELANDERELDLSQRALAHLGHLDIPRLNEIAESDPDRAEALLGLAELRAGQTSSALERLRPLAHTDPFSAIVLAQLYGSTGQSSEAAAALLDAGERFGDTSFTLEGARTLLANGDANGAQDVASRALSSTPERTPTRRGLRRLLLDIAIRRGDPRHVEAACSDAMREGDRDPDVRWTRVQALSQLRRFDDAWAELKSEPPLSPSSESQALLFLHVRARAVPSEVEQSLTILDRFADSHGVLGVGLALILGHGSQVPDDQAVVARVQAHLHRFTQRFPDSPILRSVSLSLDDPELLREQMRELLAYEPAEREARRDLAERLMTGRLPVGFAAALLGRSPLDLLLSASLISFPCITSDPDVLAEEVRTAAEALDGRIVVDLSSLVLMSFLPELWTVVTASFSRVSIAEDTYAELDDAMYRPAADGVFQWNYSADDWQLMYLSDDDKTLLRDRARQMRDRAGTLSLVPWPTDSEIPQRFGDAAEHGGWIAPLLAADSNSVPLLCDDVAMAALARSLGLRPFGSLALLIARTRTGKLAQLELDRLVRELFRLGAVDLPAPPAHLVRLAQESSWDVAPMTRAISSPTFWRDLEAAYRAFISAIEGSASKGIDVTASVLHAGTLGLLRAVVAGSPTRIVAGLLVATTFAVKASSEDVPTLVSAVRAACSYLGAGDPLDAIAQTFYEVVETERGAAEAAQFTSVMLSRLDAADVSRVTARILGAPDDLG